MGLRTKSSDFSAKHLNLHKVGIEIVSTNENKNGAHWDNNVKCMVVQIPAPNLSYFGVDRPERFKVGDFIYIGLNQAEKQDEAMIKAKDGNVFILDRNLRDYPRPGDVLCLLYKYELAAIQT